MTWQHGNMATVATGERRKKYRERKQKKKQQTQPLESEWTVGTLTSHVFKKRKEKNKLKNISKEKKIKYLLQLLLLKELGSNIF